MVVIFILKTSHDGTVGAMSTKTILIAGAGHGGVQTAMSLRQNGFEGRIVLVGDEPGLPYQRPPLSKAYLQGMMLLESLWPRPESFYRDNQIEFMGGTRVTAIKPAARRITLGNREEIEYGHLVLSVGARNRRPQLEGVDQDGVVYIRTLVETDALKPRLAVAHNIVVIGAGFIGLEFAAVAAAQGKNVTVLEMTDRAMARAVSAPVSTYFARWHQNAGAVLRFDTSANRILGTAGKVTAVETTDRQEIAADMVIISVGVVPNVEIAKNAGLRTGDGVIVDEYLITSDENISAIGECCLFPSVHGRRALRLESVQNANDQGKTVANRLTGKPNRYEAVPWFWSDQGEVKLQIVGIGVTDDETVIRGDQAEGTFSVFHYSGGNLTAIESVNKPADHMFGRRALGGGVTPSALQAADPSFDLKKLLR